MLIGLIIDVGATIFLLPGAGICFNIGLFGKVVALLTTIGF